MTKHAVTRASVLAVVLAACGGGDSGNGNGKCMVDRDCGGQTCARDGECLPASEIRMVKITWTVRGQQANATNCAGTPSFELSFTSQANDFFGYAPVPCVQGQFTMDKLPTFYDAVELDADGSGSYLGASVIGAGATVSFDLSI